MLIDFLYRSGKTYPSSRIYDIKQDWDETSIPNCLILNENKPVLSNIYGGLSGKLNKYISLSNVYYFKNKLNNDIEIIGCGGIETLEDVNNYLNNGASYVQLGSCFYNNILNELDYEKINSIIDEYEK